MIREHTERPYTTHKPGGTETAETVNRSGHITAWVSLSARLSGCAAALGRRASGLMSMKRGWYSWSSCNSEFRPPDESML